MSGLNMKSVVKTIGIKDIQRSKVTGPCNGKRHAYCVGDYVNISIKKGRFDKALSRPGTKHTGIVLTSRTFTKSDTIPGITNIKHSENNIVLINKTTNTPFESDIGIPVPYKYVQELNHLDRKSKRKASIYKKAVL